MRRGAIGVPLDAGEGAGLVEAAGECVVGKAYGRVGLAAREAMSGGGDHVVGDAEGGADRARRVVEEEADLFGDLVEARRHGNAIVGAEYGRQGRGREGQNGDGETRREASGGRSCSPENSEIGGEAHAAYST